MSRTTHYRTAAATLVALAGALAMTAAAGAASTPNEHITLTVTTVKGVDHARRAVARGAIRATGTFKGEEGPTSADDLITFRFQGGTITIKGHEQTTKMIPNLRACTATGIGRGSFTVAAGTGAYAGATGSGSYVRHTFIVGARSGNGACLAQKAQPRLVRYRADVVGAITLG